MVEGSSPEDQAKTRRASCDVASTGLVIVAFDLCPDCAHSWLEGWPGMRNYGILAALNL